MGVVLQCVHDPVILTHPGFNSRVIQFEGVKFMKCNVGRIHQNERRLGCILPGGLTLGMPKPVLQDSLLCISPGATLLF